MIKKILLALALLVNSEFSQALTSANITADTLAALPNCVHYKIEGACFWWDGWDVQTTLYVDQYLPDVVVSIFNKPGDNPWTEINDTLDQGGKVAEDQMVESISDLPAGYGQHSMSNTHEQSVYFKEADVIGNPALAVIDHEVFVSSTATPLMPYFQSMLDAAMWRGFLPQALADKTAALGQDITRYIGHGPIRWGGAFPIEGKTNATNDARASAVIAQRAINLLSLTDPGHIYKGLGTDCGDGCSADDFHEDDDHTQFQRIYPDEQNSCEVLGTESLNYGDGMDKDSHGAYVWIVWRHYHGCVQGDGRYIGHT